MDHYLIPKVPYIYYMSLKNCFSWLFIDIVYVQVIGLMVVWMYNESENCIFSLYLFNKDISCSIPYKDFEIYEHEYHSEGSVSQISYLGPGFCFMKSRKLCFKNDSKRML